jgi:hypothetical protein
MVTRKHGTQTPFFESEALSRAPFREWQRIVTQMKPPAANADCGAIQVLLPATSADYSRAAIARAPNFAAASISYRHRRP